MTPAERAEILATAGRVVADHGWPSQTRLLATALLAVEAERARLEDRYQPAPTELSIWYMHDNHTFTRLRGDIDSIVSQARELGVKSPYGMLSARLVAAGKDIRHVGDNIHARSAFAEDDLKRWRDAVMADPDAARLVTLDRADAGATP